MKTSTKWILGIGGAVAVLGVVEYFSVKNQLQKALTPVGPTPSSNQLVSSIHQGTLFTISANASTKILQSLGVSTPGAQPLRLVAAAEPQNISTQGLVEYVIRSVISDPSTPSLNGKGVLANGSDIVSIN